MHELIIVDDGSQDQSAELVEQYLLTDERVRLFRQAKNSGKGAALHRGVKEVTGDVVIIQDADL